MTVSVLGSGFLVLCSGSWFEVPVQGSGFAEPRARKPGSANAGIDPAGVQPIWLGSNITKILRRGNLARNYVLAWWHFSRYHRSRGVADSAIKSTSRPARPLRTLPRDLPATHRRSSTDSCGSLSDPETQNHLRRALRDRIISQEQFDSVWPLSFRAIKASKKLHSYLRNCDDPD